MSEIPDGFELVEVGAYSEAYGGRDAQVAIIPHPAGWAVSHHPRTAVVGGDDPTNRRCAWERIYVVRPKEGA